jgi:hypothetical protein
VCVTVPLTHGMGDNSPDRPLKHHTRGVFRAPHSAHDSAAHAITAAVPAGRCTGPHVVLLTLLVCVRSRVTPGTAVSLSLSQ